MEFHCAAVSALKNGKIATVPKEFAFPEVNRERLSHKVGTKISGIDRATNN